MNRRFLMLVSVVLLLAGCAAQTAVSTPTVTLMSELQRVASLLDGFEVEERPLPFSPEDVQAKAGLRFATADGQVDILIFEMASGGDFANAVAKLAEEGIDVAAEAPFSFVGSNGAVLFVVRNVAPPEQQEDARWVVSEIAGALAGEE